MEFSETPVPGAYVIDAELLADERGFFSRTWDRKEFAARNLNPDLAQCSISFNKRRGTLRGMHYQVQPHEEAKLVRCTAGAIYDVIVDLRLASPAYKKWFAVELTLDNHRMLYIPEGVAHGFQTLTDNSEVFYQISEFYHPEASKGVRWNDPIFGLRWPLEEQIISERDRNFPNFNS